MQTSLRALRGEPLSLTEEAEGLYDIHPAWTDEAIFDEAHRELDDLLPPGGSLAERMIARRTALEIPVEQVKSLLGEITAALRQRTMARFPLPEDEAFEVHFVKDQPWSGYNWYLGGCRSRIDINTDLPLRIAHLTGLLAHEGYPGHHTELANKEMRLVRGTRVDRAQHRPDQLPLVRDRGRDRHAGARGADGGGRAHRLAGRVVPARGL